MINVPYAAGAAPVQQQRAPMRLRTMKTMVAVVAVVAISGIVSMGETGYAHRALAEIRQLCDTRFFHSNWHKMSETYWEQLYGESFDYVSNPVPEAFDPTNIAYVLTLSDCPEADDLPEAHACDPGHAYYDAAAVLKYGICEKFAPENESSKYQATMYAIIHPDARRCVGPHGEEYDRAEVLREMGYKIRIHGTPVPKTRVAKSYDSIQADVGLDELIKLGAYKLTHHPVAVLVDFSTLMARSIEPAIDAFIASDAEVATHGSYTMIKPDNDMYTELTQAYAQNVADFPNTMKGSLGTNGLLEYYYNTLTGNPDGISAVFDNDVINMCTICGQPWDCPNLDHLEQWRADGCDAEHAAWYQLRVDFEKQFWKNGLYSAMNLQYKPDVYKGFCHHEGPGGYDLMIDDKTAIEHCDPDTTTSTAKEVLTDNDTGYSQTQELALTCGKTTASSTACFSGTITKENAVPFYNIAIVMDISLSTKANFAGEYVGDMNGDGNENQIIDAEISAVLALLEAMVANPDMNNDNVLIGLVVFYAKAELVGHYPPADPDDPTKVNPALVKYLTKIRILWGTNFDDGLDKAIDFFDNAPTGRQNIMYFMSDGKPYNSGDGDGEENFPMLNANGQPKRGQTNHISTMMYDSEIALLDAHNVERSAIGIGPKSQVTPGSGLDMIDNTPDPNTGEMAVQVLSVGELVATLTASPVAGTVTDLEVDVNGIVQDVTLDDLTSGPAGFAFGEILARGLNPESTSNTITAKVTVDFKGEPTVFTTSCNVAGTHDVSNAQTFPYSNQ